MIMCQKCAEEAASICEAWYKFDRTQVSQNYILAYQQCADAIRARAAQEGDGWVSSALTDVVAERARQVSQEGWTPQHDDHHTNGDLAYAAAAYAFYAAKECNDTASKLPPGTPVWWPWDWKWWKPKGQRRDLVRAAALIIAEIERLDRLPAPPEQTNTTSTGKEER